MTIFDLEFSAKVYLSIVSQAGGAAPTDVLILNTIGAVPVWSRSGAGNYFLTFTGGLTLGRTVAYAQLGAVAGQVGAVRQSATQISLISNSSAGAPTDSILNGSTFLVLVYS